MNLIKILPRSVRLFPDKKAIVCHGTDLTYQQFDYRVNKLASALHEMGIKKQDKIAILHKNCHYYLECYFGVQQIGAALVPLNYYLSPSELLFILQDSETKLLIADEAFTKKIKTLSKTQGKNIKIIRTGKFSFIWKCFNFR